MKSSQLKSVCFLNESWIILQSTEDGNWGWRSTWEKKKRCSFSGRGVAGLGRGVCVCVLGAGFLFAFGGVQGIIFIRVRPAPSMSTPCTRSKSQSDHRDSETRTKVARWAPCVRSCLSSFRHCYTCSRLSTEVRLSVFQPISQFSIISCVFAKVFKSCIIVYSARIWSSSSMKKLLKVCVKGSLTEKLIHTCEARVCSAGVQ